MTIIDDYPTGQLYFYHDRKEDNIASLITYIGDDNLIIAQCSECDSDRVIFKKIVDWLGCMKRGDFESLHHDERPYYAARIDQNTKQLKVFCLESGPWVNLIELNAVESYTSQD